jgi:RNA polymerase sigma factor (TIGR02999 family)
MEAAASGDRKAAGELLPLVYDELKQLAAARLRAEAPGRTLGATALVHEAYLRLAGPEDARKWEGRAHFFAAAAEAMRRILIDEARKRRAAKRGGDREREERVLASLAEPDRDDELLALDEALDDLAATDPVKADLVKLRYFAGMTADEAAAALGISPSAADRHWAFARAWLHRRIAAG